MKNKQGILILLAIMLAMFLAGAIAYPYLPERVASHWNANGVADDYMGKFWGIFLFPIILAVMFVFYIVIPKIDPLKANIESFRKYYDWLWIFLFGFLAYIFGLSLTWNLGYRFNFSLAIIPAIAVLWFLIGVILEKTKPNWFVGIRTPWTISDPIVWEKTHKLGSKLFKAAAIISLIGLFFPGDTAFAFIVTPAIAMSVIVVIYSYFAYKKLNK